MTPGQPPDSSSPDVVQASDPSDTESTGADIIAQLLARIKGEENPDPSPVTTGAANAGQILGSLANDERLNRLSRGNLTQNYDQTMLQAQTGRNTNENDALRKMAITSYLKSGGYKPGPGTVTIEGQERTLPSYGAAPRPASAEQMASAGTLEDMLTDRLKTGGSYLPQPLESYAEPGTVENVGRYGGTAASGLGAINDMLGSSGRKSLLSGAKKLGGSVISGLKKIF